MRNEYDLKPNRESKTRSAPSEKTNLRRKRFSWQNVAVCCLIFGVAGAGTYFSYAHFSGNSISEKATKTGSSEAGLAENNKPPRLGDPSESREKNPEGDDEWWDPETNPDPAVIAPEPKPDDSSSVKKGSTQNILHNNWRDPDMSRKPDRDSGGGEPSNEQPSSDSPNSPEPDEEEPPDEETHLLPPSVSEGPRDQPFQVSVWYPRWDEDQALQSLQANTETIDEVNLFGYQLQPDGSVGQPAGSDKQRKKAVQTARKQKLRIIPTITNQFSPSMLHELLKKESRRKQTADNILRFLQKNDYHGAEIQFQPIYEKDRDRFSLFIEELSQTLHDHDMWLSVAVYPKVEKPGRFPAQRAQDWSRLGKVADSFKMMAYNYSWGEPGPMTPISWMDDLLTFAENHVPAHKIYVGLSWYGYYWQDQRQYALHFPQIQKLLQQKDIDVQRDPNQEPYVEIQKDGETITGYYQDRISYEAKLNAILDKHPEIAGVSHWYLGTEDPGVWKAIQKEIGTPDQADQE
ncbi:glycosyl hydrolase family 18 protein [Paludifilum halophilum]|uniref:GH18 domain-containing protein n=1 Tax=Paludifilum halophilum TaxID=1642702 RepID=A0A235B1H0_9BACL|nr:glycosyl hydrolase family 18 protein [Paludifilum halophilum]OYD06150.1 hypothetical protein CHM34_17785 [Paludifilum halophilum]